MTHASYDDLEVRRQRALEEASAWLTGNSPSTAADPPPADSYALAPPMVNANRHRTECGDATRRGEPELRLDNA